MDEVEEFLLAFPEELYAIVDDEKNLEIATQCSEKELGISMFLKGAVEQRGIMQKILKLQKQTE